MAGGRTFRKNSRIAMENTVLPAGFVERNGLYVRNQGHQYQEMDFRPELGGIRFTLWLGFHYAFIPDFALMEVIPFEEFCNDPRFSSAGCWLTMDVASQSPTRLSWSLKGNDEEVLGSMCRVASLGLAEMNATSLRWEDPRWFIERCPASCARKIDFIGHADDVADSILTQARHTSLECFGDWTPHDPHVSYSLGLIAAHIGDKRLAKEYFEIGLASMESISEHIPAKWLEKYRGALASIS